MKAALPAVGLVAQQRRELRRGEVAEVEDLEVLGLVQRRLDLLKRFPATTVNQTKYEGAIFHGGKTA